MLESSQPLTAHLVNAQLAAIVEASDDGILSKTLDGIILSWNKSCESLYGYTAAEAIGQSVSLIIPPDRTLETEEILARIRQGERVQHLETVRQHKDGSLLDVSLTVSPLLGETGRVVGASAIARDISEEKRARQALERSERLYHTLARNFPNGSVMLFDRDLRLVLADGRGLVQTGLEKEGLIGQPIQRVFESIADSSKLMTLYKAALSGKESLTEVMVRERTRLVHIVPVHDEQGNITGVMGMSQDITEQNRVQEELREREERFRQLAENIDEVFWMSDPATRKILYVNPAYEKVWGRTLESLYQDPRSFIEAIHLEDRVATTKAVAAKQIAGEMDHEYRIVRPDGVMRWIWDRAFPVRNEAGEIYRLVGIAQDITERKEAQEALQKERDFSTAVLDTVGSLVVVLNPHGRLVSFNRACEQLTGYSFEEVQDKNIMDLVLAPEEAQTVKQVFKDITVGQFPMQYENYWITKEGGRRWIAWSNTALLDENGAVTFVIGTGIDITERQQAEESLRKAHQELQRTHAELEQRVQERTAELAMTNRELRAEVSERQMAVSTLGEVVKLLEQAKQEAETAKDEAERANRAKSEFLSRMSHELRTPLNAILGFGQLVEMETLSANGQEGVGHILKSGQHLLDLINEILEISRIEAGHLELSSEPIDVALLVREMLDLVRPLASQQRIQLITEIPEAKNWHVLADQQRLKQVLLNLMSNAVKYNREDGRVTVIGQALEAPETPTLRLEVIDTGLGLNEAEVARLFTPFERLGAVHTRIEGTGIGLALSKQLMGVMGGSIGVETTVGRGSAFWIELPLVSSPQSQIDVDALGPANESIVNAQETTRTLLYIEDNLSNLRVVEMLLQRTPSVKLLTAMQGSIGLELARQHHPNLILLDLHLPDMMGDELLRRLKAEDATADIPVVILSADATRGQIERLLASGADQYLTKPIDIKKFLHVLEEMLA